MAKPAIFVGFAFLNLMSMKNKRFFIVLLLQLCIAVGVSSLLLAQSSTVPSNLAVIAKLSSSRGSYGLNGLNDLQTPVNGGGNRNAFGGNNRMQPRTNIWVQYDWEEPITTAANASI